MKVGTSLGPVIRSGASDAPSPGRAEVAELQERLKAAGFYTGEVDGVFGRGTRRAVLNFQAANGLQVDGAVGDQTRAALDELEATLSNTGTAVRGADGHLDAEATAAKIGEFQREQGLVVDGMVGAETLGRLQRVWEESSRFEMPAPAPVELTGAPPETPAVAPTPPAFTVTGPEAAEAAAAGWSLPSWPDAAPVLPDPVPELTAPAAPDAAPVVDSTPPPLQIPLAGEEVTLRIGSTSSLARIAANLKSELASRGTYAGAILSSSHIDEIIMKANGNEGRPRLGDTIWVPTADALEAALEPMRGTGPHAGVRRDFLDAVVPMR